MMPIRDASGWYVYGEGTVDPTGAQVIPDPGVQIYEFTGAMVATQTFAPVPVPPPVSTCGGDPVECSRGLLVESHTDFFLPDVIPIQLTRTYRTLDGQTRQFGKGMSDNYDLFLTGDGTEYTWPTWAAVVLPDGAWVYYTATNSPGVLLCQENSGIFYGSVLAEDTSTNLWSVTLKNGTILTFPVSYAAINSEQAALIRIEDRYGNQLLINRDSNGFITKITSPHKRYLTFNRPNGSTLVVTDNSGRQVTYGFDADQNLSTVTDANGGVTTYSYTYNSTFVSFQLTSIKDPRGYHPISNVQYDACGRVSQETEADGVGLWKFSYTPFSTSNPCYPIQQTTITDPRGYQEQLTFDSVGFVTHILTALGYPEGQSTTIDREETYNTHLINSITDPLGRQTCYTYDGLANVTAVTRLCNSTPVTTKYTYESHSQMSSVQDPLGHKWTINYDSLGSPTSIVDPLNHTTTLNFSSGPTSFGVLNWVADALNNKTQFFYNSYGDLDEIIDPRGSATYRNTDTVGRVTSIEDPLRNTTSFQYDNLDHLKLITDPKGGKTQFGYDQNENLTSVIDAQWTTYKTQYGYDAMNRRISRTDALNKAESYQYDESSNLTKYTDRNGNYVNYSYDGINRRISASFCCAGQDYITYTWDGGDRLTKASDALAGSITRHPDLLDRLTSEVSPQGTVSYTYDNADRRQTMTVAGQNAVNYTYDIANRLTQISQSGVGTVGFQYDNADRRTLLTLPNGVTQTYVYDNGGQGDSHLTSLTYKHGNTTIGTLSYGYDADGRRGSVGGSLAAVSIPQAVTPNTFNADNAMTLFDSTGFSRAVLSYDSDGQMTSDQIDTYTWDVRRHLSAISGFDTASFVYDALGRRVSKTVNGTTTKFLYDGLNPVQELNGSNGVIANMLTGLNIDEYFARTEPGCCGPLSYLTDALGSTLALTDSSGTVQNQYQYEPFGNAWSPVSNNTSTNSYQFTGRENDGESGYDLDYYRGRYYSPVFQRFISQDPIEFMGGNPNLYAYANNSPSNFGDQYGLETGFVSLESSQNPPPFPPPDVTIGVDSPIGGVQTTLPFASGGKPTTVTRPLSWTQPLLWPPDAVAKVFIETSPGKSARLQCQVRSPFVGLSTGIDTNGNPNVGGLGPQINFPIPETGVNFYVGTKWGTPGAITK